MINEELGMDLFGEINLTNKVHSAATVKALRQGNTLLYRELDNLAKTYFRRLRNSRYSHGAPYPWRDVSDEDAKWLIQEAKRVRSETYRLTKQHQAKANMKKRYAVMADKLAAKMVKSDIVESVGSAIGKAERLVREASRLKSVLARLARESQMDRLPDEMLSSVVSAAELAQQSEAKLKEFVFQGNSWIAEQKTRFIM